MDDTTPPAGIPADPAVVAAARETIEQAKGAVMLVYSVDADHAFAILRETSQALNIKLRVIAAAVVAELPEIGGPEDLGALREDMDRVLFGTDAHTPAPESGMQGQ
ncbi:ANTAR domain-containing protein [Nocardia noduli]|uniref:ANTAR domain-containing protein n=1 Tax=Nocardia noduli TaxID=2815722 RepID=UPI001C240AEC|nr:ANTAR domain-containing protein [Nocardia noduli]